MCWTKSEWAIVRPIPVIACNLWVTGVHSGAAWRMFVILGDGGTWSRERWAETKGKLLISPPPPAQSKQQPSVRLEAGRNRFAADLWLIPACLWRDSAIEVFYFLPFSLLKLLFQDILGILPVGSPLTSSISSSITSSLAATPPSPAGTSSIPGMNANALPFYPTSDTVESVIGNFAFFHSC